jgi:hypothetical protein
MSVSSRTGPSRRSRDLAERLHAAGVVDTHFHVGPELLPRRYDAVELARRAKAWNATLVLKNHTYPTTPLAALARRHEGARLLGGTVLNGFVGGINPDAVVGAASGNRTDVREEQEEPPFVVWMPTVHAQSHLDTLGHVFDSRWGGCTCCEGTGEEEGAVTPSRHAVPVFDRELSPHPALMPLLEAIAKAGARLATGHLSAGEIMRLVPMALDAGVPAVLLTHPHYPSVELSNEQLVTLSRDERVFIEHCFAIHTIEQVPLQRFADSVEATGTGQVILSTDFGQVHSDPFPECTIRFARSMEALWPDGLDASQLIPLFSENPRRALGLPV